jgi:hypothetical protein
MVQYLFFRLLHNFYADFLSFYGFYLTSHIVIVHLFVLYNMFGQHVYQLT